MKKKPMRRDGSIEYLYLQQTKYHPDAVEDDRNREPIQGVRSDTGLRKKAAAKT